MGGNIEFESEMDVDVDTATIDDTSDEMVMSTAKMDNLERFPVEILEKIFIRTNDIGLLQLADTCTKFEAIAKNVFSKRYSNQHFVVNDVRLCGDPEYYLDIFNHFGSSINAIQINHADFYHAGYIKNMLQPHTNHIKKLTFEACLFKATDFLSQFENLSHFVFRNGEVVDLPEYGNLIQLDIRGQDFSMASFKRIIRNNPTMQSLLLHDFKLTSIAGNTTLTALLPFIAENLHQLKELALVQNVNRGLNCVGCMRLSEISTEAYVNALKSLKHLKSLALPVDVRTIPLLPHIGTMSIENLGLHIFPQTYTDLNHTLIENEFLTGHQLPNFRHLTIELNYNLKRLKWLPVSALLRKYPGLEKITIIYEDNNRVYPAALISADFFDEFMETINTTGKPNARIEAKTDGDIIGSVSANGIIWRKKLMYWNGCNENLSNIHLLNLADQPKKINGPKINEGAEKDADKPNLLDSVFDYLDIRSLQSFAETSVQSEHLVKSYIKRHLEKQEMFIITDEIYPFGLGDQWFFNEFNAGQYATNLKIYAFRRHSINIIFGYIKTLGKLSISKECVCQNWYQKPLVPHIVYDSTCFSNYSKLSYIADRFPDAETIEFKNAGLFCDFNADASAALKCNNLKKFIFNYRGETQIKNLKEIFKGTSIQLIPILKNNSV